MSQNKNNNTVWNTRVKKKTSNIFKKVGSSIKVDKRLYKEDILASVSHAEMLYKQKIITIKIKDKILWGLRRIQNEIEKKNFKESSLQMNKAHVGNIENLKIILTSNITNPIKQLKKNNFTIYCLDNNSEQDLKDYKFHEKSLLIFGSEGKGVKNYIKEQCNIALKIKINPNVESLNLSNAVAITLSNL